ncbi:hypothetical protein XM38_014780 [Halomicronema hongdechloris C2206]|uniref:Uncharacterized protein n=1 Tax=Halomicronema hongdechloris C2206 TaxID=1641165 RepID=A0A1Z3HJP8_9CYAN|nr:hypothetical protein [Halomicronema hongdechloris]ASC70539.1 hypothetical protein XM38_014780 [Halomicronema hongdechloris C2206]
MPSSLLVDAAADFTAGVAMVRLGNRLGYIDTTGRWVITVADDAIEDDTPL